MEIREESASIPSRIHEVESPVPVPSSKNRPDGLDAASVRSNEQVSVSDAMVNPAVLVDSSILAYIFGKG